MSVDCQMLGALLSERRRGELTADQARALEAHLDGCARCRAEARGLESVLAAVELPAVGADELGALRARRIADAPRTTPGRRGWPVPAVLVAAAAAALLTVTVRPLVGRDVERVEIAAVPPGELVPDGDTQELFPDLSVEPAEEAADTVDDDALALEGPGLFGNLDG